jgi:hypothetical protein
LVASLRPVTTLAQSAIENTMYAAPVRTPRSASFQRPATNTPSAVTPTSQPSAVPPPWRNGSAHQLPAPSQVRDFASKKNAAAMRRSRSNRPMSAMAAA